MFNAYQIVKLVGKLIIFSIVYNVMIILKVFSQNVFLVMKVTMIKTTEHKIKHYVLNAPQIALAVHLKDQFPFVQLVS